MEQTGIAAAQTARGADGTHGPAGAHPARARPVAQQEGEDAAAAGGFLALLAALDQWESDGPAPDLAGADIPAASLAPDSASQAPDASVIAAWQSVFYGQGAANAAQADGTANVTASDLSIAPTGQTAITAALERMGKPQGLVAETARLDGAADLANGQPQRALAGPARAQLRAAQRAVQWAAGGLGQHAASAQGAGVPDAAQYLSTAHGALASAPDERPALAAQWPGAMSAAAARGEQPAPVMQPLALPMGAQTQALQTGAAPALARGRESMDTGRSGADTGAGSAWPGAGAPESASGPGLADDAALYTTPNQYGADERLADQIAYRVHQKTQSAELTLQRDGQPVEVSLSLSGNQAHVAFRSDQAQTRALLDQGMAQLSELLRGEGLVLSGMSVGTPGSGDGAGGNAGTQDGRDGLRRAQPLSRLPAGLAPRTRAGGATDHALDVFV